MEAFLSFKTRRVIPTDINYANYTKKMQDEILHLQGKSQHFFVLRGTSHFDCYATFPVIVSLLKECVHDINNIRNEGNGRVETGF